MCGPLIEVTIQSTCGMCGMNVRPFSHRVCGEQVVSFLSIFFSFLLRFFFLYVGCCEGHEAAAQWERITGATWHASEPGTHACAIFFTHVV